MFSTGSDMAEFLLAMVDGGKFSSNRILTEASVKEMVNRSVTIHPDIPGVGYGLETIYPQSYNGHNVVEKGGDLPGFHANLWLLPDQNTGMFIAFNSDKGNIREPFIEQFMNRYFPQSGDDKPVYMTPAPTKEQLMRFEGQYNDLRMPGWGYDITATDGTLIVEAPTGKHILRQADDMLFYDEEGIAAGFKVDWRGIFVTSLTTRQAVGLRGYLNQSCRNSLMCRVSIPMQSTSMVWFKLEFSKAQKEALSQQRR